MTTDVGVKPPPTVPAETFCTNASASPKSFGMWRGASISVHGDLARLPATVARGLAELLGGVVVSAAAGSGRGRPDITIAIGDRAIDVMVADRGAGPRGDVAGLDLVGMLERAQHLGGRCTFTLDPDGASVAHWDIPYVPVGATPLPVP